MVEISVIVPVYKVKEYIYKCVDSILNQTFRDIEIILVDDGCPDLCGDICEEYSKRDSRVQVIHKVNGGLSDARNVGFKHACGKYVIFIDSDDYIENDMLEYLYSNITESDADVSTCGVFDVYENGIQTLSGAEEILVCSAEEFYSYILQGTKVRGEIWNKLIKRSAIIDIEFPKGKLYEDIFFTADMVQKISKVCIGTVPKYYYLHRTGSITGKPYRKQLLDIIEGYEKTYQVVCRKFPKLEEEARCLWIWSRFIILDKIMLEDNYKMIGEFKEMVSFLREHRREILKNRYFRNSRKVAVMVLSVSVRLYHRMVLIMMRKQAQPKE